MITMPMRSVQRFEVSLKGFIVRDGRALLVREADTGWWELPGGRIDVGEEWLPHSAILSREMQEELGLDLRVEFGTEVVTWTRQRPTDGAFLFLVARIGLATKGEPHLSPEHSELRWAAPTECDQLQFPPASGYREALIELWRLVSARRDGL